MSAPPVADSEFWLRFWGVRGTIACPGGAFIRYGGNTSCIEVRCGPHLFILDAGTGLRGLGAELVKHGPIDADLLLTHTHLDHIAGMPFFPPVFKAGSAIRLWAGHLGDHDECLREVINRMVAAPLFPVPLEAFAADLAFKDFHAGDTLEPKPGVVVKTAPLNHPNGATGYRIEFAGRSVCYVTDVEHFEGRRDETVLGLIKGADIFIYDCTYSDEEYPAFKGWGHSTWQEGARLANAAGVKRFVVFHHAPEHDDDTMDRIADEARWLFERTIVAREGMILRP